MFHLLLPLPMSHTGVLSGGPPDGCPSRWQSPFLATPTSERPHSVDKWAVDLSPGVFRFTVKKKKVYKSEKPNLWARFNRPQSACALLQAMLAYLIFTASCTSHTTWKN